MWTASKSFGALLSFKEIKQHGGVTLMSFWIALTKCDWQLLQIVGDTYEWSKT